jgi:hypothetical protein
MAGRLGRTLTETTGYEPITKLKLVNFSDLRITLRPTTALMLKDIYFSGHHPVQQHHPPPSQVLYVLYLQVRIPSFPFAHRFPGRGCGVLNPAPHTAVPASHHAPSPIQQHSRHRTSPSPASLSEAGPPSTASYHELSSLRSRLCGCEATRSSGHLRKYSRCDIGATDLTVGPPCYAARAH